MLLALICTIAVSSAPAFSETISGALALAYRKSPDLNAQRAATRAADENLPAALSGLRPTVSAEADVGVQQYNLTAPILGLTKTTTHPLGAGFTVTESLYNNRTFSSISQAKAKIAQSRQDLSSAEVTVLKNGVTAYMNVLRDTAILDLRRDNVKVLVQQLGQTRARFNLGEITLTDIYQAQTSLAQGRIDAATAYSNLRASIGGYQQVIGELPKELAPARPIELLLPHSLDQALGLGQSVNPSILSAVAAADVAVQSVKVAEAPLYPTAGVTGTVAERHDYNFVASQRLFQASLVGQLNVPLYDGGTAYAQTRQAKELLGQALLQVDVQRNQTRAAITAAWAAWQSTATQLAEAHKEVHAAEGALKGVREEAKLGERTTLDVLNAQQVLMNARLELIQAQYARVVGSYYVLGAIGNLSAGTLDLAVVRYDPLQHFDQVKDKWFGLRSPEEK